MSVMFGVTLSPFSDFGVTNSISFLSYCYIIVDNDDIFLCTSPVSVLSKILSRSSPKIPHLLSSVGGHCTFSVLLSVEGTVDVLCWF